MKQLRISLSNHKEGETVWKPGYQDQPRPLVDNSWLGSSWTKPKGKSLPLTQICIPLENLLQGKTS